MNATPNVLREEYYRLDLRIDEIEEKIRVLSRKQAWLQTFPVINAKELENLSGRLSELCSQLNASNFEKQKLSLKLNGE